MTRVFGLLGIVIALAVGWYIYTQQATTASSAAGGPTPRAAIDVAGVQNDLLAFANAEKQQFAMEGKYLSLDGLRAKGSAIPADRRAPWTYSADVSDTSFRITASYEGPDAPGVPKMLTVSENMMIETVR